MGGGVREDAPSSRPGRGAAPDPRPVPCPSRRCPPAADAPAAHDPRRGFPLSRSPSEEFAGQTSPPPSSVAAVPGARSAAAQPRRVRAQAGAQAGRTGPREIRTQLPARSRPTGQLSGVAPPSLTPPLHPRSRVQCGPGSPPELGRPWPAPSSSRVRGDPSRRAPSPMRAMFPLPPLTPPHPDRAPVGSRTGTGRGASGARHSPGAGPRGREGGLRRARGCLRLGSGGGGGRGRPEAAAAASSSSIIQMGPPPHPPRARPPRPAPRSHMTRPAPNITASRPPPTSLLFVLPLHPACHPRLPPGLPGIQVQPGWRRGSGLGTVVHPEC
ncbi:PREDICTED: basic proline-rich protein-like [Dipodomys ordii]|uniref:Basic proline-rich protein-like n=1 Tax=Dipodomys ordii TaxID=10020 RepID=A0A1S3F4T1_DIPOR|nr:PREDICTED: basic proline-rich protein-like [Dipodomys ordii]